MGRAELLYFVEDVQNVELHTGKTCKEINKQKMSISKIFSQTKKLILIFLNIFSNKKRVICRKVQLIERV